MVEIQCFNYKVKSLKYRNICSYYIFEIMRLVINLIYSHFCNNLETIENAFFGEMQYKIT